MIRDPSLRTGLRKSVAALQSKRVEDYLSRCDVLGIEISLYGEPALFAEQGDLLDNRLHLVEPGGTGGKQV